MTHLGLEADNIGQRKWDVSAFGSLREKEQSSRRALLEEDSFVALLYLERRRAERAGKRFVLVLIDISGCPGGVGNSGGMPAFGASLLKTTRETDIVGWYLKNSLVGVIGTDLGAASDQVVREKFLAKIQKVFDGTLEWEKSANVSVSFHFFPEEAGELGENHSANITLYPELKKKEDRQRISLAIKRGIDILGSLCALLFFAPVFAAIAVAIKLSSQGPVLFRQERLGQAGKPFMVFKFRSMRTDCDARIHQQYVSQFIAGKVDGNAESSNGQEAPVFKIQKDPRITRIGQLLRKTSLDELPQFWNVLRGDMSLVGPRPPVAYEYRAYEAWHRRRVLEIKPGITGLWQVEGRSRTRFDDMVRMDLRYSQSWSLWLDVKILLRTPAAVITGEGAH